MQDWLEPFRFTMEKMERKVWDSRDSLDTINRSSLLWRMIYHVVKEFQRDNPSLKVVRHEDLSIDPQQGFQNLYIDLGLPYTPAVLQVISDSSNSENPKEVSKQKKYSVRLDSRSNLDNWKRRLSKEEIHQIRSITEDVAEHYYPDSSWD
jgi:hypothetical protein